MNQSNGRPIGPSNTSRLRDRQRLAKIRKRDGAIVTVITQRYTVRKEKEKRVSVSSMMQAAEDEFHIGK